MSCTSLDFCRNDGVVCVCAVLVTGRVNCVIVCVRGEGGGESTQTRIKQNLVLLHVYIHFKLQFKKRSLQNRRKQE